MINNYEIKNRNYQILQNINNINTDNIKKDLNNIINENDINNKFQNILNIYNKMNNTNDIIENNYNKNEKIIYILKGEDTCKRYNKNYFDDFELNRNEESILLHQLIDNIKINNDLNNNEIRIIYKIESDKEKIKISYI